VEVPHDLALAPAPLELTRAGVCVCVLAFMTCGQPERAAASDTWLCFIWYELLQAYGWLALQGSVCWR
jgi:hypothetical protein